MKKIFGIIALFMVIVLIGGCGEANAESSYLTVEINPSLELVLNKNDEVEYVNALNEDGEVLLVNLNLEGLSVDEAMDLIIAEATELGFIDPEEETTVNVTTVSEDEEQQEKLEKKTKVAVEKAFVNRGMRGIAKMNKMTQDIINEAAELGISAGKLRLIKMAQILNPELTTEEAIAMKVSELVHIIKEKGQMIKNMTQAMKQEFFIERDKIRAEYAEEIADLKAQIQAIEEQLETATNETEIANLNDQLDTLEKSLGEIYIEISARVKALRDTYKEEIETKREERKVEKQKRVEEHKEKVKKFRDAFEQNKEKIIDTIREWQEERNKTTK